MKKQTISLLLLLLTFLLYAGEIKISDREQYYHIFTRKALTNKENNNLLILYKDSILIAQKNNNIDDLAFYNLIVSKLYYNISAYNNSIEYGKSALNYYEQLKDTSMMMLTLINMGAIYGNIEERKIAYEYFARIDTLAALTNDSTARAYNLINLGLTFSDYTPEKTLEYYKKAELFFKKNTKDNMFKFYLFANKASTLFKIGKYREALNYYFKAYKIIDSTNNLAYTSVLSNIAVTYSKLSKYDSSFYFLNKLLTDNKQFSTKESANIYSILTENFLATNQNDSAVHYYSKYREAIDSLLSEKHLEYVAKLKVLYETDKLVSNIKTQKLEIEKANTRTFLLSVISILFASALIVFIVLYKKLQHSYKNIVKESVKTIKLEEEFKKLKENYKPQEKERDNLKEEKTTEQNEDLSTDLLFERIVKLIENEKLYLKEDLTINDLIERLNTNRTYISNAINSKTGMSFVKFINNYRINEAKKMLLSPEYVNYTLEGIGKAAGFKSNATFYRVFKAETGVTPSFFNRNKNL